MSNQIMTLLANVPTIGGLVGIAGGSIGAISGIAAFARRRLSVVVTVTENNDQHSAWHTVTIANRSDLALSFRDLALAWHIATPLGRLRLNWAYLPDDETKVCIVPPHGSHSMIVSDEEWSLALPRSRRKSARLRALLHLPTRGRGVWLPVRETTWVDETFRERLLGRMYGVD